MSGEDGATKASAGTADTMVTRRNLLAGSAGAAAAGGVGRWAAAAGAGTLAAALLATNGAAQQQTKSRLYDVIGRKSMIGGTGNGNPPWHSQDEQGNYAGFDSSLPRVLAK